MVLLVVLQATGSRVLSVRTGNATPTPKAERATRLVLRHNALRVLNMNGVLTGTTGQDNYDPNAFASTYVDLQTPVWRQSW